MHTTTRGMTFWELHGGKTLKMHKYHQATGKIPTKTMSRLRKRMSQQGNVHRAGRVRKKSTSTT